MKTIEERAREYAPDAFMPDEILPVRKGHLVNLERQGFIDGVKSEHEALTKWNSPECPPDDTREILVKYRTPSGDITYEVGHYVRTKAWYYSSSDYESLPNVIGWREIHE